LLRRRYEGHPVPDVPTSPGDHSRVLPPEVPRVPEEQLLQTAKRKMRLFADDPLQRYLGGHGESVLRESVVDLIHPDELRELGLALYLDRPLGDAKQSTEPDATLLLASEAFSPSLAAGRLGALTRDGLLTEDDRTRLAARQLEPDVAGGLPVEKIGLPPRPGTVALTDARMAASDFTFRQTLPGAVRSFVGAFDFAALAPRFDLGWLTGTSPVFVARAPGGNLAIYDAAWRRRLELTIASGGYSCRRGVEFPAGGLLVVRAWTVEAGSSVEHDLAELNIVLNPKIDNGADQDR
jgi:hypothetical protein